MDPWISSSVALDVGVTDKEVDLGLSRNSTSQITRSQTFEDDFIPSPSLLSFQKLPDSEVYLASLEKKLSKIQSTNSGKEKSKEILKSLEQSRESCMLNLLSGTSLQDSSQEDLKVNSLLKKIQPEKQALTAEELILLVKVDQLSAETHADDENEQESKQEEAPTPQNPAN